MHPFSGVPYPTPTCILSPQYSDDKLSDTCCGQNDSNSEPGEDDAFEDDLESYTRTVTRGSLLSAGGDDDTGGRACTPALRATTRLRRRLSLGRKVSLHRTTRRRYWVYRVLLLLGIFALYNCAKRVPYVSLDDVMLLLRKRAAKTPFVMRIALFSFVHYMFVVFGVPTTLWEVTFALCVGNACFVGLIVSKVLALLTAHFIVELPFVKMRVEAKIRQQPVLCAVRDIAEEHPLRSALLIRWCYIPTSVKNYTVRTALSCYTDGAVGCAPLP
ncbi:MAG: uncharacterized protein KVP18_002688 [Porospora cf. gigantea A]|uniref:uncharacterized protein n=1 Tax=Porospora cf. gigantea A TaxID=2853593 RepID=UPI0035595F5B|nr:MAG: hypothetical protein KVP18_002688 [Porospora cf. gigantea A]